MEMYYENLVVTRTVKHEHDDRTAPNFRNRKGGGSHKGRAYNRNRRDRQRGNQSGIFGGPGPRSRLEDLDGDVTMGDTSQDSTPQNRFTPYQRPGRKGDGRFDRDRRQGRGGGGRGGFKGDRSGAGGGGGKNRSDWWKVTIPHGRKYDKRWLLTALQNLCSIEFTPVNYQVDHNKVHFYVDDTATANAIHKCSHKITDTDGYKVEVHTNRCAPPSYLLTDLKPEHIEHLKQCMAKRFDASQQALDLNNIRTDPDLVSQNVEVILNRKTNMEAVIKIIEGNIPELAALNLSNNRIQKLDELSELVTKVPLLKTLNLSNNELKSDRELDKLKGLKLVELWLNRNPLCDLFKDQAAYISAVRQRFPRLLKLDGNDLPAPIGFDVESPTAIPPSKGSYFGSDEIKALILPFLQQYYNIYDSGDRQPLLDAYHDGASLSLTTPYSNQNPSRSSLGEYHKDSRNLKRVKDTTIRYRLLKHTRLNVVAFLNELPKTQHDIASFTVDVNTFTNTLLSFTVSGVFKEVAVDGKSRDSTMAFSRVFITVPAGNSGLCIVNDQIFIRMATTEEIRRAFVAPAPTPSSSPVPTLTAPQQEMLSAFSQMSGMNLEWSQKCLLDNQWDFNAAAQVFTQLKTEGKIPDVAFMK
ncbi:nuclear RNA export factor 1 isoform X2 [Synchiropus splendidus]|uniref:nuclear RNA export factor 1 isoform X2 n=1 Tax=Synchiropus splendidus TaxID=270530 RepID=UPI00237DF1EE|nr:nuclear RNA export factor 1 isoform X2 [Synchiropus splendidus]XP_053735742.1 nuclear RNA export factor 1 isoform X2 [Synchiropus splendidus]XP_053735743.1 nuclear RNA export factor 1 isoform X2 [Synchiropus splendidus]XP_053735744.1 nuclear RNA export factor 1 isoform X2 [Synchiropus splendidus]